MFPILALYAHNVYETAPRSLAAPIGVVLAGTLVLWLVLWGVSRDRRRAALAASLIVALFYAFNSCTRLVNAVLEALSTLWVPRDSDVHPLIVLGLLSAAAAPVLRAIFVRLKDPGPLTTYLNTFALVLTLLPVGSVVRARWNEPARPILKRSSGGIPTAATLEERPDIYFIVLDAYARSDVMKDLFGFDNEPFLRRLERKGFFVARQGTANYCQTSLSLASTLNCAYLDTLINLEGNDLEVLGKLIRDNLVMKSLRPHGYKFIAFATGYDLTECPEADEYLAPRQPGDNFQMMLVRMTPARFLPWKSELWDFYTSIRDRTLFALDRLPEIAARDEPTFTFAHIIGPHHPFVFGEDGEDISPRTQGLFAVHGPRGVRRKEIDGPKDYLANYPKQAKYLTRRVEEAIDRILANSPRPPIIILQSDHGSGYRHHLDDVEKTDLRERMSNLNCYYFPGRKYEQLSDRITPVNSFRAVLNACFGADEALLDDRNYFSTYTDPFRFVDVTERLRSDRDRGRSYAPPSFYPGLVH